MVHEGLKKVLNGIVAAAQTAGRAPGDVTLIAVSKTFDGPEIIPVAWPDVELHLIGPLQSNKAAEAVQLFDAIHTVDRPKIATAIATEIRRQSKPLTLFVQVNTGREPQKAGIDPDHADAFLRECRELHGLEISGLMCIPPAEEDPKRHFTLLAEIATRNGLTQLSMGMSGDYASAIACGATHVRVGSAIFGTR